MSDDSEDYARVLSAKEKAVKLAEPVPPISVVDSSQSAPAGEIRDPGTISKEPSAPMLSETLSFVAPRETARVIKARKQRSTGWLRIALPIASGVLLLALLVWPMVESHKIAVAVMKNIPDLVVDNLHFTGLDSKSQPYSLTALKATRPSGQGSIYDLDRPEGDIALANGTWVAGKAQYGRFDEGTHRLWLGGNVQLFQDKGYQFTTDEAQVELQDRYAWGEKPVLIQGSFGEIRGQGFRLLDGGETLVVKGPAKAILSLHPNSPSDKPTAAH